MQFNSIDFMLFFPIVLLIYFIIPKKLRGIWLLLASYYFYMSWNPKYAVLIAGSTVITWASALLVDKFEKSGIVRKVIYKKLTLVVCLVLNLGVLAVFKYGNFAISSLNVLLYKLDMAVIDRKFDFLLPVGISFYTFQALGYIMDVYRGEVEAEKNLPRYALFVSFFPQLVAGPIERSKNLFTQMQNLSNLRLWNAKRVTSGAILMVWGFFMKMVIADRVSLLVDNVFDNFRMYGSTELILAMIGFTIQIYCDFASYSLIAIGSAKIMGFELMENFNAPYFARNIKDFWNRWHISLSTWFKDYLYIPLGGNRKGTLRKYFNLIVIFLASGLWHGANWTYVVWGGIHGIYRVVGEASLPARKKLLGKLSVKTECFSWKLLEIIITFGLVSFAWIFFRADSIKDAVIYIQRIFTKPTPWLMFNGGIFGLGLDRVEMNILFFSIALLILVDLVKVIRKQTIDRFLMEQNIWFEWIIIIFLIVMTFVFGEYGPTFDAKQFIYFQF